MDLLEYQAKQLFREVGIPTLPAQTIYEPGDLKQLQIPYPVVLKSQVRAGGRAKAGGIRFIGNTIDAIAAARTLFNLPIAGERPPVLMAEARYRADLELFVAIVFDYQTQRPALLGSVRGGTEVAPLLDNLQTVIVEDTFSAFYARELAVCMGLQGNSLQAVSEIVTKMYRLFWDRDLELIEINPLALNSETHQVMALDGKITVNNRAVPRHPELLDLEQIPLWEQVPMLGTQNRQGRVGLLCNNFALGLSLWDEVVAAGLLPAFCLILGQSAQGTKLTPEQTAQQIETCWKLGDTFPELQVWLLDIPGELVRQDAILSQIHRYLQRQVPKARLSEELQSRPTGTSSPRQRNRVSAIPKPIQPIVVNLDREPKGMESSVPGRLAIMSSLGQAITSVLALTTSETQTTSESLK
ncbi:MAG: ATP-grasp domain-containing protein [Cyanobacteria bacterium P01_H01_bin.15]